MYFDIELSMKEVDIDNLYTARSSISADNFVRLMLQNIEIQWEEVGYNIGLYAYFLVVEDNKINLKVFNLSDHKDNALSIIKFLSKKFDVISVCFHSLAVVELDGEKQESILFTFEHKYASPSRQFWRADIFDGELYYFDFIKEGLKGFEILENLDNNDN